MCIVMIVASNLNVHVSGRLMTTVRHERNIVAVTVVGVL